MYYFLRITPANAPYALWLRLRGPVAAWKIELPRWLAGCFTRVRPYEVFSRDEWLLAHDTAFDAWQRTAFPILAKRHRAVSSVGGRSVDFSRNLWQMLGAEFEALCLFACMLEKDRGGGDPPVVVEPWIARAFTPAELAALFPGVRVVRSAANRWLEGVHEWLVSAAHLARTLFFAVASLLRPRRAPDARPIAWLGVSPQEIPDRDDRLNFAWAAQYGHVPAADVLFFPPCDLAPAQRAYLASRNIAWLEPKAAFDPLPRAARLRVAARSLAAFACAFFRPSAAGAHLARFLTRAYHWDALFSALGTTTYVTTTSYAWPEKPELAVTAARGMRSIIWAYSANSPTFAVQDARFRDLGIARSIVIAGEFWVWNRAYLDWTRKRQVETGAAACDFRIKGPLMCGNPALLALDRAAARARLGVPQTGLCIGVFDMPPMNDAWRDEYGGGPPMISLESYVAFWESMARLLARVPDAYALIKLKRGFDHPYREVPDVLKAMIDENGEWVSSGRIRVIDVNVDPYLPVAASDVAIGVAYTSPILAARSIGRPAFYLDPLGLANFPSCMDYKALTVRSDEDAVAIVLSVRPGAGHAPQRQPDAVTPPPPVFSLHAGPRSPPPALQEPRGSERVAI